jgi:ferric-dicitrate binding protein FerR (iron transport regulator)
MSARKSGRFEAIGRALADLQDQARDAAFAQRRADVRAAVLARPLADPRSRAPLFAAAIGLAAAVLALVWILRPTALTFEVDSVAGADAGREPGVVGAWLAAGSDAERALAFSDGSRIALRPRTRARVAEIGPDGASFVLERGAAVVSIESAPNRRWLVDAGPYRIRVTGTRFLVAWDPVGESLEVELHEGAVVVEGPGIDARTVAAGERLQLGAVEPPVIAAVEPEVVEVDASTSDVTTPDPGVRTAAPIDASPSVARAPSAGEPARARVDAAKPAAPAGPDWKELARAGKYRDALSRAEEIGIEGLFDSLPARDLLRLADVARFARAPAHAIAALEAVRRRFPDSDEAATAAFERGRLALAREPASAAGWFETYLRERPDGSLAREAMGRWLEALEAGSDGASAAAVARRYLERWPKGPHADLASRLAEAPD